MAPASASHRAAPCSCRRRPATGATASCSTRRPRQSLQSPRPGSRDGSYRRMSWPFSPAGFGGRLADMTSYADYRPLTFHDAARRFTDGNDSPRAYLERCLETIAAREPVVKALTAINEAGARAAADASGQRWKAGKPLSLIDGTPVAIKDLLETKDMATEMGCAAM